MLLLGFDFEATSVEPETADIIEFAFVLWDTDLLQPVRTATGLLELPAEAPGLTSEVEDLTGISTEMLCDHGMFPCHLRDAMEPLLSKADATISHNGLSYDLPLLKAYFARMGTKLNVDLGDWPHIDTMYDLPYPATITTRKLIYLCTEHGFMNPFPHRALFDVMSMLKLSSYYDMEAALQSAKTPMVTVQAMVTFKNKDLAKDAGFRWDSEYKIWTMTHRQGHIDTLSKGWKFKTEVI
jgi:DNA polymerase-3 subunit epsilon